MLFMLQLLLKDVRVVLFVGVAVDMFVQLELGCVQGVYYLFIVDVYLVYL